MGKADVHKAPRNTDIGGGTPKIIIVGGGWWISRGPRKEAGSSDKGLTKCMECLPRTNSGDELSREVAPVRQECFRVVEAGT